MADPTRATIETEWANAIKLLDETEAFGNVNATNFIALLDTLQLSYAGDWLDEAESAAQAMRSALNGMIEPSAAAAIQRPFLKQYMKSVTGRKNPNDATDLELLQELYKYFIDNSLRVQSRVFTFGSPTATAGNIGDTQVVRLTKDRYNFDIENQHIDSKRITCILDHNTGTDKGNESWLLEGQASGRDDLERSGSGIEVGLAGQTVDDSIVENAGFQSFSGTAASPTGITDWSSSGGDSSSIYVFDSVAGNVFRAGPSDGTTSYSLQVKATTILSQKLSAVGKDLDASVPYILAVVWNRDIGSGDGTLVLRMGNVSTSVTVSAQTGWTVSLCPGTQDWAHWYPVFAEDDVQIDVDWTRTSGDIRIAEVLLVPGTFFDGSWYWVLPNDTATYAAPLLDDEFTFADNATVSIIQKWLWRGFNVYLPHADGSSITWTEP